jgi:Icc protein
MKQLRILLAGLLCGAAFSLAAANHVDVTIAQISDTHLGEKHSPDAADHLRKVVEMINARHPDAVIVSGDIGENSEEREQAKTILKALAAPVYYVPGNHEFSDTNGLERYRQQFGPDYYRFQVKNVEVLALNSQLLGNYQKFDAKTTSPLSAGMEAESQKMFAWLDDQAAATKGKVVIAVQHIPLFRDHGFPADPKPYWTVNVPYAQHETDVLHNLGVKHLLAGHWHIARVFEQDGITIHVAPATSWLPLGGQLGFDMHTITAGGDVNTEFVPLPKAVRGPAS